MSQSSTRGVKPRLTLHLELRAIDTALAVVRDAVESLLRGAEVFPRDDDSVEETMLAIQEACNNVVMHAYPDLKPGPLVVTVSVHDFQVVAEIEDSGVGFSLDDVGTTSLDGPARKGGGYGLFLMRGLMDEVSGKKRGSRNVLILTKRLIGATE